MERVVGIFRSADAAYRQGFEAAIRPKFRGRSHDEAAKDLRDSYPEYYGLEDFKRGYERAPTPAGNRPPIRSRQK